MEEEALEFAAKAHGEQQRKYSEELYIEHPKRVAGIVRTVQHNSAMICAAYLHDVVEDTPVRLQEIQEIFGKEVAALVDELTDEFVKEKYPQLNRKKRKEREVARQATMSRRAKTVKLADVIDNVPGIVKNDRNFARRYIPEMEALTKALQGGDEALYTRAIELVNWGKHQLKMRQKA
ncbi:MAG: HD domain-containing protein [Salinimicrobium sp.]